MCLICVEINKGNLRTRKEVSDRWSALGMNIDNTGPHSEEVIELMFSLPEFSESDIAFQKLMEIVRGEFSSSFQDTEDLWLVPMFENECTCGAKHTSTPKHHSSWCDKDKP